MTLCNVCKNLAELGMPCFPRSCQCTCHRKSRQAADLADKRAGIRNKQHMADLIVDNIKKGGGFGFHSKKFGI